jgi:hypothetical protein
MTQSPYPPPPQPPQRPTPPYATAPYATAAGLAEPPGAGGDRLTRLAAPSHRFDLQLILTHCHASRRLTLPRDGVICAPAVPTVVTSPIALVIPAIVLIVLQSAVTVLRFLRDVRAALRAESGAAFLCLLVREIRLGIGLSSRCMPCCSLPSVRSPVG